MRTRRSPHNQDILWRALGGTRRPEPRPRRQTQEAPIPTPNTLWARYCLLFDAGLYREALPVYAAFLAEQAKEQ